MNIQLSLDIIDPIADKHWDEFVMSHPDSTVYHYSPWMRVLQDRYERPLIGYVLKNQIGDIFAGVPFLEIPSRLTGRRITCLPYSELCYPLAVKPEYLDQLLSLAKSEVDNRKVSYLEIRGWGNTGSPHDLGLEEKSKYARHMVALDPNPEKLKMNLCNHDRHFKQNLRKAESSGITVRETKSEEDIKTLYLLNDVTRQRLNLMPWPYQFLQSIYEHMIKPGHASLYFAEWENKPIAATLSFRFKDTIVLKFNCSNKQFTELRPNYLLTWRIMEQACKEGYKFFDFGTSDFENKGLIEYKRQWGSQETVVPFYYYFSSTRRFDKPTRTNPRFRQAYLLLNRLLPHQATKLMGRFLYKHLG